MAKRALVQAVSIPAALACLGIAAYLAFDWADYGIDSTCGNLVTNRKWDNGPCTDIMRNRSVAVLGLILASIVLLAIARGPRARRTHVST